jgi:hypothetical protein
LQEQKKKKIRIPLDGFEIEQLVRPLLNVQCKKTMHLNESICNYYAILVMPNANFTVFKIS